MKADARRPKHERRTAKALYAEIRAAGYDGGYTRVTDRFEMQSSSVLRAASMLEATQTSAGSSLHARQAELDRLRHETEANAERTIADLKRRFTSVSREVSDQIAGLNRQVNATTSQVHERTQAAKGELENTRVLITQASQMPAHARESVEGVRRTLQEQLKALEALSSFSRDQASLRDVTPPEGAGPPQQRRATTTEPATRPVAVEPSPQQMALNRLRRRPDDRPPAQQSNQSAAPGPATVAGDIAGVLRETTWSLGDLLARASREDEEGGGMPPAAAADARPIDLANIAEAIDAQTAANAWSRYRSGERGVFSRQLYSRQGQMTFDEITRRYQADNGFRAMSDRYLADFERLLREAEAKDQSGRLVQNHLVAETGRVYLLLAHASGRIG